MSWAIVALGVAGIAVGAALGLAAWARRLARSNRDLRTRVLEIERAATTRTRFIAKMSHELRTPLNAVIGFAELLDEERSGPVTETQHEHLSIIRSSADHLLTLVDEVLDLAKIDVGEIRLNAEPVQPVALARQCVTSLGPLARQRRVSLELAPSDLEVLELDPARLRQVILNYVSNAIRFTPPGGRVKVRLADDGGGLRIEVSDTGIGISSRDQGRIFEEFVQVEHKSRDGNGLGLAVTKQIVEAQGGYVGVHSRPGRGSTFYAWLPCEPGRRGHPDADPVSDRWLRRPEPAVVRGSRVGVAPVTASGR